MPKIECTLGKTLDDIGITKNKLAVESKVRPNTISDIALNKARSINFETLEKIVTTLNTLDTTRTFDITDVFVYSDNQS